MTKDIVQLSHPQKDLKIIAGQKVTQFSGLISIRPLLSSNYAIFCAEIVAWKISISTV